MNLSSGEEVEPLVVTSVEDMAEGPEHRALEVKEWVRLRIEDLIGTD